MARIEKTVFISYRRKDISWALAVYQYLMSQKYDVFFDYTSLSGGDFEQVIISNIKARAHFILILTPTALDRCNQPGDWLRREIETAIDEKRNIIPLFFEGFNFGNPSVIEKLTGKLVAINHYNGLDVPGGYFIEAMERLCGRYLNLPLNSVLHPVNTQVRKKVDEERIAANNALLQRKDDIQKLIKPSPEKQESSKQLVNKRAESSPSFFEKNNGNKVLWRPHIFGAGILLLVVLGILGVRSLINTTNATEITLSPQGNDVAVVSTPFSTKQGTTIASSTPLSTTLSPTKPAPTHTLVVPSPVPSSSGETASDMISNDGMKLIYIPDGSFKMGSDDHSADESPVHEVFLGAFLIDQTEVTNAMYAMCVQAGSCSELSGNVHYLDSKYADHPVTSISWNAASNYCSWADRRLPTEAEWEKAARSESFFTYPWGNIPPDESLLNYNYLVRDTTEVGIYPLGASPYGALDMAGNVWEWVNDWYGYGYYSDSPPSNPPGPDSGTNRVIRGGGWQDANSGVRTAKRGQYLPTDTGSAIGFRCAMDASE
jgi:formylglycine-generating enzyme required for sulfatase activity